MNEILKQSMLNPSNPYVVNDIRPPLSYEIRREGTGHIHSDSVSEERDIYDEEYLNNLKNGTEVKIKPKEKKSEERVKKI
jgi:hypothetical protein